MRIVLSNNLFSVLEKNVPDAMDLIADKTIEKDNVSFEVEDIMEFQLRINEEIVCQGMDNEDTVNDLGIKLYEVYDEILYQKHHQ